MGRTRSSSGGRAQPLVSTARPRIGKHVAVGMAMIVAVTGILAGVYYWPQPAEDARKAPEQAFLPLELTDEPDPIAIEPLRAEAESMAAQLVEQFPDSFAAHRTAATLHQYFVQYDAAVRHWQRCVEIEPENVRARVWLSQAQLKLGKDAESIETLRVAQSKGLKSLELVIQLAAALQQSGQPDAAEQVALDGILEFGDQLTLWISAGNAQMQLGKIAEARDSFSKAVELDEEDTAAHIGLGGALARLDETLDAEKHRQIAQRLIEKKQQGKLNFEQEYDHGLRHVVATVMADAAAEYDDAGDRMKAELLCRRAMEIVPGSPDPYRQLANLYHRQGRLKEALLAQQRLTKLEPDNIQNHLNLASLALQLRRAGDAENVLLKAVERFPSDPILRQSLATFYLETGNSHLAREHADELVRMAPSAAAYRMLSDVCRQQGDKDALAAAEKALQEWQR